MIRIQVEAHVGAITNLEAAKQAGYEVVIQSREARPGYPIHLVSERIFNASDGKLDEKFCVAANETESHRDGTFGIEEAHVIGDLLKITQVYGAGAYTVSHVVTHTIHPSTEKRHRTLKVSVLTPPTLGLEG